jgi:acrylyl-CoA reductase (NADPH)
VTLYGIDSVMAPLARREAAWAQLATGLDRSKLAAITHEIGLGDAINAASDILAGQVRGRLVVNVNA